MGIENAGSREAFQNILDVLSKLSLDNIHNNAILLELLETCSDMLPLFVRIDQDGELLLHAALANGASLAIVRLLVEADESKQTLLHKSKKREHMIPLHMALSQKNTSLDVIEYLLNADESQESWAVHDDGVHSGRSPLHFAAARGLTDICQQLIQSNPELALAPDKRKRLPLHYAAASGIPETVQTCIANSLDTLLASDENGALPLHFAESAKAMEVLLLADVEKQSWQARTDSFLTPLHRLVLLPFDTDLSVSLLQNLIEFDECLLEEIEMESGLTPLHMAIQKSSIKMIQAILSSSPFHVLILRCRKFGNLPIHYAVARGLEITRLVVEADPTLLDARNSNPGNTPLATLVAMPQADPATVEYLLKMNAFVASIPDDAGLMPLHKALLADGGEKEIIQMLLEADRSAIYVPLQNGMLPLHVAACASSRSLDVLQMLLEKDPARKNLLKAAKDGSLPIHQVFKGHFVGVQTPTVSQERQLPSRAVVEFLLREDTECLSLIARDCLGRTPLHYAARIQSNDSSDDIASIEVLTNAKPESLLIADNDGNLPLHLAANQKYPSVEIIQMLVSADAFPIVFPYCRKPKKVGLF